MQKFNGKLKNVPIDASQVCRSTSTALNKDQSLSVQNTVLPLNSSDENLPVLQASGISAEATCRKKPVLFSYVYVLNMRGKPLMPTTPQKAKKLLKVGRAKILSRKPFIIQLACITGETMQRPKLGVDSGYAHVGLSAVTEKAELFAAEVLLRTDIVKLNQERKQYRRGRRNRHTWYRQARFLNRKKPEGWIAPSLQNKVDTTIKIIKQLQRILPIADKDITIEIAAFDTQKMINPEISGIEYQQGELSGYETREYLLEKWGGKCAYCEKKDIPLQVEHIIPKSRGGSNRVDNLTIACGPCNTKKGKQTAEEFGFPEIQEQAKKPLKEAAFMNLVRKYIADKLQCNVTFGFVTKYKRTQLGLEKSHINDAFVIAGGTNQTRCVQFALKQVRRNNRGIQLNRKGFNPSIRRKRYAFQPHDMVRYNERIYEVKGVSNKGTYIRLKAQKDINTKIGNVTLLKYACGMTIHTLTSGRFFLNT